jgi:hypothetical protein
VAGISAKSVSEALDFFERQEPLAGCFGAFAEACGGIVGPHFPRHRQAEHLAQNLMLASAQRQFDKDSRDGSKNPADPYMTALCYFNALRELGASRRIIEDEVATNLRVWPSRRLREGQNEAGSSFAARNITAPDELTSRLSTDDVAIAKERLEQSFTKAPKTKGQILPLDVALATNMISAGLDITRLGLMFVQNQPKSAAEYIQATSRVGRDCERTGIVRGGPSISTS